MALSQVQCLDDNNVNPRTHAAKPEFFYCENQRLALEVLLRDGREAFHGFLKASELRGFLSDPELETLTRAVEPYDPGSDVLYSSAAEDSGDDDDAPPLSLHYWPDLSDTSVPDLDLGWPDSASYRGVTRTNVYTQPPLDGQVHIKEVVRKTIAQAQKVIAVVMDLFTDVDIFRDLLDAGYKRKVSVYILLDRSTLPHFLSMCDRANMHPGHLKNLRVRCAWGGQFLTRSCTRLCGRVGHRFMFVDGDKALSGSYRYTWRSSRLDQHLITVITGQAVDTFDRLFRQLYGTSSAVDLKQVAMELEPESNPLPQPVVVAPSSEVARKLHNPMYALLGIGMNSTATPAGPNSPADPSSQDKACAGTKGKRNMQTKAPPVESPPIHPGLVDLEKAYLIPYLPTWPEPDPSSDVIGFINVCDSSRKTQAHMQRSERFETSQAIRFSSPFNLPEEILPEVAQPRQRAANHQDTAAYSAYARAQDVAVHNAQPTSPNTGTPATLAAPNKPVDTHILTSEPIVKAEKHHVDSASEPSAITAARCITAPHVDAPSSLSDKAPVVKPGSAGPPRPVHGSRDGTTDTDKNAHSEHVSGSDHIGASSPASSQALASPTALHPQLAALPAHTQNRIAHKVSCKQDLGATPQSPSKEDLTPSLLLSTHSGTISPSTLTLTPACPASGRLTSPPVTTSSSVASSPSRTITTIPVVPLAGPGVSSPLPPFLATSSSSASNPSVHSHATNTSALPGSAQPPSPLAPPVPKPRTVHLLIDSGSKCNVQKQPPDTTVVSEHGKWSGSGPVVDDYKSVKQLEDDLMTSTPIRPHTQSILTGNILQPNDKQLKEIMPQESRSTYQGRNTVRSHSVIEELGKREKDSEIATNLHIQEATHCAQANELQQHSQTRTATASEPTFSFHTLENNHVIDAQLIAKPNQVTAGALSMTAHTQQGPRVVTTTHPSNDEAMNNTRDRLHSAEGEARLDPRTAERKKQRHILELPAPQLDEAPAGRLSPSSPQAWRMPDALCCSSPGARTPTPDTSDGYISSRDDSTLSTTSDEYYECDESLRPSPVTDQGIVLDGRAADDRLRAPHAKRKGEEDEGGGGENKAPVKEDTVWATEERGRRDAPSPATTEARQPSPAKTTKRQEGVVYPSAKGPPDPPPASAGMPADAHSLPPTALRRSSSSASSENTVSPFITPVPSPAPTPTTKRAASRPRAPPPDSEVGRPGGPGGPVEGKQVLRRDGRQEGGELIRKWEEHLRRDRESERDQEFVTQGDLGASPWELRSETSSLRTSGAQVKKGPWGARETEVKKVLRSPPRSSHGRPKQQNHYSPPSHRSPAAKPARPGRPSSGLQAPRSYLQAGGKAEQDSFHSPQSNSASRQPPYRRHSSTHAAEQERASEDFSRRSLHYAQPPASGQGSGCLPKPQPSFLYTYNNTHSQQHQAQPGAQVHDSAAGGQQSKHRQSSAAGDSEPGDAGQDLNKTGFSFSIAKLYSLKELKNKGRGSPSPTKRNPDPPAQVRKSTG